MAQTILPPASRSVPNNMLVSHPHDRQWFDVDSHRLKLVHRPTDRLQALTNVIEQADAKLKLFFYMFEGDDIGQMILNILIAACKRGVTVMIDSFGSNGAPKGFFDPFEEAGGSFGVFRPRFSTGYFVRNHQKMVIADNSRAMIGGFNIANQYFNEHPEDDNSDHSETSWEDLGIIIEAVPAISSADGLRRSKWTWNSVNGST